ncbi:MAG: hypothetical protein ACE5FT_03010 [Candidatus Nanoarchaeia archaeon]
MIYHLLKGENTLVLPSDAFQGEGVKEYFNLQAEFSGPIEILSEYHTVIGELTVDPFDFASSNGSLRFSLRPGFTYSGNLNSRRLII